MPKNLKASLSDTVLHSPTSELGVNYQAHMHGGLCTVCAHTHNHIRGAGNQKEALPSPTLPEFLPDPHAAAWPNS